MAKLEVPIRVYMGELGEIINELKHLQTYKLFEGDDKVLISCDDAVEIFANHLRTEILSSSTIEPNQKKGKWIPVKSRPMDEEERAEWSEKLGYDIEYAEAVIYTSQLPDDGQEVLTCSRWGNVQIDKFENDPDYGCFFEKNGDMDGIVAWMPLPEPWKGENDG